jgi:ATP-dependent helicase HrpB
MTDLLVSMVLRIASKAQGKCILVFLSGIHRIWEIEQLLHQRASDNKSLKILKLHSQIPKEEEDKLDKPEKDKCTIILSTTVAESSLTIDALDFVFDSGLTK